MCYRHLDLNLQVALKIREALAIMTGSQCNTLQKRGGDQAVRAEGFATQVWVRGAQGWQISSLHATRLPS